MYTNIRMLRIANNEIFEAITTLVSRRAASLENKHPAIHGLDVVITEPHRRNQSGRKHDILLSASVDHRGIVAVRGQEPQGEFDNPLAAVDHAFDMLENRLRHQERSMSRPRRPGHLEEQQLDAPIPLGADL
ncbi:MAG: HPF/RaiA family ribosome-associated protein [Pseudomonadota bacterium]